eukprot:g2085.t1
MVLERWRGNTRTRSVRAPIGRQWAKCNQGADADADQRLSSRGGREAGPAEWVRRVQGGDPESDKLKERLENVTEHLKKKEKQASSTRSGPQEHTKTIGHPMTTQERDRARRCCASPWRFWAHRSTTQSTHYQNHGKALGRIIAPSAGDLRKPARRSQVAGLAVQLRNGPRLVFRGRAAPALVCGRVFGVGSRYKSHRTELMKLTTDTKKPGAALADLRRRYWGQQGRELGRALQARSKMRPSGQAGEQCAHVWHWRRSVDLRNLLAADAEACQWIRAQEKAREGSGDSYHHQNQRPRSHSGGGAGD